MKRLSSLVAVASMIVLQVSVGATAGAGKPTPGTGGSTCTLPPTDLCTSYSFRGYRWAPGPIPYYVNLKDAPPGAEQDIHDAFLAWQNEVKSSSVEQAYPGDGSSVSFVYMGTTTAGGMRDGLNVVYFEACDQCGGAFLANRVVQRKSITQTDIQLNTRRFWTSDESCPTHSCGGLDIQNVLTHEIGHMLDLYHVSESSTAELTMHPGAAPDETKKRDLGAGDVLGLRAAYPN